MGIFDVKLDPDDSIAALKKAIKEEQSPLFDDIRASDIRLFQIAVPDEGIQVKLDEILSPISHKKDLPRSLKSLSDLFNPPYSISPNQQARNTFPSDNRRRRPKRSKEEINIVGPAQSALLHLPQPVGQERPFVSPWHRLAPTTVRDETRSDNGSKQLKHSEEEENEALKAILAWRMEAYEKWVSCRPYRIGSDTWMLPDNAVKQLSQKFSEVRTAEAVEAIAYPCGWSPLGGSARFDEVAQVLDKFNNEIDARRGSVSQTTAASTSDQLEGGPDGGGK
ncbi:hypothetical protein BGZ79_011014 [Entomortierella chlamydospora]|nr:hypothetical protein BGZ79_011014 [Entomortierella chlamydospora]